MGSSKSGFQKARHVDRQMQVIGWESSYDLLEILEELNVTLILMHFFFAIVPEWTKFKRPTINRST